MWRQTCRASLPEDDLERRACWENSTRLTINSREDLFIIWCISCLFVSCRVDISDYRLAWVPGLQLQFGIFLVAVISWSWLLVGGAVVLLHHKKPFQH